MMPCIMLFLNFGLVRALYARLNLNLYMEIAGQKRKARWSSERGGMVCKARSSAGNVNAVCLLTSPLS